MVGQIGAPFGIKGWVHVKSFTDPPTNLMQMGAIHIEADNESWRPPKKIAFTRHNNGLIAQVDECEDRTKAEQFRGCELAVQRHELPELDTDEHYWVDLVGVLVMNTRNESLGHVVNITNNGASTIIETIREDSRYLIPLVRPILQKANLPEYLVVDWDTDWQTS